MANERPWSLAEKLTWLIRTVPGPDGKLYESDAEIARQVEIHTGKTCNRGYIGYLKRGERDNPTLRVLTGLAKAFDVDLAFFLDDDRAAEIRDELIVLKNFKTAGIDALAFRALAGLTPQQLGDVIEVALSRSTGVEDPSPDHQD